MNLPQRPCSNNCGGIKSIRVSRPESCSAQNNGYNHFNQEHSRTAGYVVRRVSDCQDDAKDSARIRSQQLLNRPVGCESQQLFLSKDVRTLKLQATDTTKRDLNTNKTGIREVYSKKLPPAAKPAPHNTQSLLRNHGNPVENAQVCSPKEKLLNSVGMITQDTSNNLNNAKYINSDLVQKILGNQQNLRCIRASPVTHLGKISCTGKAPVDLNGLKYEKSDQHLSDVNLKNKMFDCTSNDIDTVSTESQRESGYHSGDSAGDRSSAISDNVDLNQPTALIPDWIQSCQAPSETSSTLKQCDYYFIQADTFMDMYIKQEQLGNLNQALAFLNKAIEFFQMAGNVHEAPPENILRVRVKHNKAVLCQRKLVKQINAVMRKPLRRLPCLPQESQCFSNVDSNSQDYEQFQHKEEKTTFNSRIEPVSSQMTTMREQNSLTGLAGGINNCEDNYLGATKCNIVNLDQNVSSQKKNRIGTLVKEPVFSYSNQRSTFPLFSSV